MKKEREILWTKPTPKGEDLDYKNLIILTKEEEKKLFAGKLKHKDLTAARATSKPKPKTKRKVVITKGKK